MAVTASGTRIIRYPELPSTNVEAMRLAQAGEPGPLWVVADVQSAGKGRSGRTWTGAPGNLFASYLFQTPAPVASAYQLSLVAGVAVFDAIVAVNNAPLAGLRLKWPNDILVGRAKVGGILIESSMLPRRKQLVGVIGIGLNLASHPDIPDRDVADLNQHGLAAPPNAALDALDAALRLALADWNASTGFAAIRAAWMDRAGPLGEPVSVQGAEGPLSGYYAGLDEDGALLIELEGGERHRCTYGDVTLS